jgi:hypothetical protein
VCRSQFQSTAAFFNGYAHNRGTFTVAISTTATGPTQTIFTHAGDVDYQLVKPRTLQSAPIAVLPPNGLVCGDPEAVSRANRVGASTVPVLWFNQEYDADGNQIGPWGFNGPTGLPTKSQPRLSMIS